MRRLHAFSIVTLIAASLRPAHAGAAESSPSFATWKRDIEPVLARRCFDCHGDGSARGGVTLDGFGDEASLQDPELWRRVLKNVRLGMMPPAGEETLAAEELATLTHWLKRDALALDPRNVDPGRAPLRRLNRVEYRNTIRDLMGVDFDTSKAFPADDAGHGFDNIADVLTISPLLLERYLDAAQLIVSSAVPTQSRVVAEAAIEGRRFAGDLPVPEGGANVDSVAFPKPPSARELSFYFPATIIARHHARASGRYQITADLRTVERFQEEPDLNRCRLRFLVDGESVWEREFARMGDKVINFNIERAWASGAHTLAFAIEPLEPASEPRRLLRLRLDRVTVRGPLEEKHWVKPAGYQRFFPLPVPDHARARERYARRLLGDFAARAFRRAADAATVDRLVDLATEIASAPGGGFEAGIAQAMVAVLASPRFLFREEGTLPLQPGQAHPLVDEYALASRLSYFLWSSMPDARLFRLARQGRLRQRLSREFQRMLADARADELVRNFAGQWLQARDIGNVDIDPLAVCLREHPDPEIEKARETFRRLREIPDEERTEDQRQRMREARQRFRAVLRAPKPQLTPGLRKAMRLETEMSFAHVLKDNRSLLELIDSDYTFLNEELAGHYDIAGVTGTEMRKVKLPSDSPRGGVLTQGTVLAVTSNPTRTSPVKRGVFILDAILGTPPAPPPPNIPALEDVASKDALQKMSLRQTLDLHAREPLCRSCHNRMDPLGLALENFNALGMWREADLNQPIEPAGRLTTGESFADVRALKRVLANERRRDFFYNIAEKLLTYALGRGTQHTDVDTIDQLVAALERDAGRPRSLLKAIVLSVPFQARRRSEAAHSTTAAGALP
jgi:mono/diheme cytochrome c family protein